MTNINTFAAQNNTTAKAVIESIRAGDLDGQMVKGVWYVNEAPAAATKVASPKKESNDAENGDYGFLGVLIGIAASIWFFFGMNIAEFKLRHISLYEAFTDASLQAANGITPSEFGGAAFWVLFVIGTGITASLFGFIGSFAKK